MAPLKKIRTLIHVVASRVFPRGLVYDGYWRRGFEQNSFFCLELVPQTFEPWNDVEPPDLFTGWHVRFAPGVHRFPEPAGQELSYISSRFAGFGHKVSFLRVRGRVSASGTFGHFGLNRREILITEILEQRAPTDESRAI